MLENFLADLKASLTASHIVRDIEVHESKEMTMDEIMDELSDKVMPE